MLTDGRLFKLAVEALVVTAVFEPGEGWRVTVASRRQGEAWADARKVRYDRLSSAELEDVLALEIPDAIAGGDSSAS